MEKAGSKMYHAVLFCSMAVVFCLSAASAQAGIYYTIEMKGSYEDNIVGLLSERSGSGGMQAGGQGMMSGVMGQGMGGGSRSSSGGSSSSGDASLDLYADLGGARELADDTSLFLTGSAEQLSYSRFTEFNATIGGLSAGIAKGFGDSLSARLSLDGQVKRYGDSGRDGSAYGASLAFKEMFSPRFWLREGCVVERNRADLSVFSYDGSGLNLRAGYGATEKTTLLLGYAYLVRSYDQPAGFKETAGTWSLGFERKTGERLFLDGQYSRQTSDANAPGTTAANNIYSLGLRYSY